MFKNTAGQKVTFLAIDTTTNLPKTGDAPNLTAYVSIDDGSVTSLGGSPQTAATEKDATNAPGLYDFAVTQGECNGDKLVFAGRSNTSGVRLVPVTIYTRPPNFGAMSINSSGQLDIIKINGTSQTARDIGASVLLSAGTGTGQLDFTSGIVKANLMQILGTLLTETAGQIAAGFKKFFNIATPAATMDHLVLVDTVTTYTGNTVQTGDAYARIGANGASLSAIPDLAGVTTLLSRLSALRAGYLDNINNAALATTVAQTGDSYAINVRVDSLIELGTGSPTYYRYKTTALEQAPTGGAAPSAATVAAAVWNEARSSHVTAGTFGEGVVVNSIATDAVDANALKADAVTEIQSGLSTLTAAGVRTAVGLGSANLDTQLAAIPTAIQNADALLNRDMSSGTDSGSTTVRTPRQALRFIRNKWTITTGTLSVKKEDDSTESWAATVTGTAGADPVTSVDPNGP